MDPGRHAMIIGQGRRDQRDITSPRRDSNNRVTKPGREGRATNVPAAAVSSYLSQDEQSRRFVADEDKFVLGQAKKKADIRVREGRAKPIDHFAFALRFVDPDRDGFDDEDDDFNIPIREPTVIIERLSERELKDLEDDITSYETLEKSAKNKEYWTALKALCADRRHRLRPNRAEERAVGSVASDIDKIMSPKTLEQLVALEKQIRSKLASNEPIDTDYWEELLKSLLVWKAKAKVKRVHEEVMEVREEMRGGAAAAPAEQAPIPPVSRTDDPAAPVPSSSKQAEEQVTVEGKMKALAAKAAAEGTAQGPNARFANTTGEDFSAATKALYERELARGIGENEEIFTEEETVATAAKPKWADKYRPRKPRYFNRVQMGYEWNKYNQTHYDHDNPPPKVVQGYKFNIFYPDLIDKAKAPTFKIIREHGRRQGQSTAQAGQEDTCLIRFTAGPPYEDIAFRIVDREWDYSAKKERGFRSTFDKGILQLHFQFKRVFYRK